MVKKTILILISILIVILAGTYYVNSHLEKKTITDAEKAKAEVVRSAVAQLVIQLVKQTNAIDNWGKELCKGEDFRDTRLLTVEVEKLWLKDRPILFIGSIKDVVSSNEENYVLEIERNILYDYKYYFGKELQLALQCPKEKIDSLLKSHPNLFSEFDFNNGVAVIAEIEKIEKKSIIDIDGYSGEILIGKGRCIDIVYTGEVQF